MLGVLFLICSCGDDATIDPESVEGNVPEELFDKAHVLSSEGVRIPAGSITSTNEKRAIVDASVNIELRNEKMSGITTRVIERAYVSDYISSNKIKTQFKKDLVAGRATIGGQPAPQPKVQGPLNARTIIFTKSGNTWSGSLEESAVSTEQRERIEDLARIVDGYNNRVILGTIPRSVGGSWRIKPTKLNTYAGGLKEMDGSFDVSFRSLVIHDGYVCAKIVADFDLIGSELAGKEMRMTGKIELLQSLDYHIPLRMKLDGEIDMANPIMNGIGRMRTKGAVELLRETILVLP
ncbi:MAG: hypothetical protein ACPIA7_05565 [Akkermansiaceae bacterium]